MCLKMSFLCNFATFCVIFTSFMPPSHLPFSAAVVYPSPTFDAGASLKAAYDHSCTAMHGVPTMFIAMLNHPTFKSERCRTLRTGVMAGSVCPIETVRQVIDRMHMKEFTIGYGMTETSPVSFQTTHMDSLIARTGTKAEKWRESLRKWAGKCMKGAGKGGKVLKRQQKWAENLRKATEKNRKCLI